MNVVIILIFTRELTLIEYFLSLVLLSEGGLGLVLGGAAVLSAPTVTKIEETLFHVKPWNATRQKDLERQAKTWFLTAFVLIFVGFLVSAF